MVASKTDSKRGWGVINNILQWSLLLSIALYLVVSKNDTRSSLGELDTRILRSEALTKQNEIRITLLANVDRRNRQRDKIMDKKTVYKVLKGKGSLKLTLCYRRLICLTGVKQTNDQTIRLAPSGAISLPQLHSQLSFRPDLKKVLFT